jgi:peptide-methionine (S)-S-oxide reductase
MSGKPAKTRCRPRRMHSQPPAADGGPETHFVKRNRLAPPFPRDTSSPLRMGCFWGGAALLELPVCGPPRSVMQAVLRQTRVTRKSAPAIRPCGSRPGRVRSTKIGYSELLKAFWESHDPTQGCVRAATRHAIPLGDLCDRRRQLELADDRRPPISAPSRSGHGGLITTEVGLRPILPSEEYHQQYLRRIPTATAASADGHRLSRRTRRGQRRGLIVYSLPALAWLGIGSG